MTDYKNRRRADKLICRPSALRQKNGDRMPHKTTIALATMLSVVIVLAALDAPAPARAEDLWCASVQGPDGGYVSCGYASWQQCQAALSGQGGICYRNPGANGQRPRPRRGG
jgi:hypothetical protein